MSASRHPSKSGDGFEPTDVASTPVPTVATMDGLDHDDSPTSIVPLGPMSRLSTGMMVGEYRIERLIGTGGMGEVFAAIHPLIGKRAAIKVLRDELCRNPATVERFIDEARIVNEIGHSNIVDVFAFGQLPDGRHYFVMEWLKGESLRTRIARSRLAVPEMCAHIRPLARALMAAHAKGIVHRDLKPDNVFLVETGEELPVVKLLDFGIAKLAHTDHRMEQTASGAMLGTPQYIAPEQAKGVGVDHRADIYALGGIIYEMITGQLPFVAGSALEVIALHLMQPPRRPSSLVPLPRELDDLVVAMLAKEPSERPTLATVCDVIERVKHAPASPSHGAPGVIPAAHVPPRSRLAIGAVIIALGAGTAFVVGRMLTRSPEPAPTPVAPAPVVAPAVAAPAPPPTPAVVAPAPPPVVAPVAAPTPEIITKPTINKTIPKKPRPRHDKLPVKTDTGSDGELLFEPGTLGRRP